MSLSRFGLVPSLSDTEIKTVIPLKMIRGLLHIFSSSTELLHGCILTTDLASSNVPSCLRPPRILNLNFWEQFNLNAPSSLCCCVHIHLITALQTPSPTFHPAASFLCLRQNYTSFISWFYFIFFTKWQKRHLKQISHIQTEGLAVKFNTSMASWTCHV